MNEVLGNNRLDVVIRMYDVMRDRLHLTTGDAVLFFTGGLISVLEGAPSDVADIMREDIEKALQECDIVPMLQRYNRNGGGR